MSGEPRKKQVTALLRDRNVTEAISGTWDGATVVLRSERGRYDELLSIFSSLLDGDVGTLLTVASYQSAFKDAPEAAVAASLIVAAAAYKTFRKVAVGEMPPQGSSVYFKYTASSFELFYVPLSETTCYPLDLELRRNKQVPFAYNNVKKQYVLVGVHKVDTRAKMAAFLAEKLDEEMKKVAESAKKAFFKAVISTSDFSNAVTRQEKGSSKLFTDSIGRAKHLHSELLNRETFGLEVDDEPTSYALGFVAKGVVYRDDIEAQKIPKFP